MHPDIFDNLRWRTGVVLFVSIFKSIAIVIADTKERKISISVSGPQRMQHFAIIRKTFSELHKSFEKLNVTEWIPLPDMENFELEYQDLLGYEEAGKNEYFVGKLKKEYKVKALLDGIEPENIRKDEYEWDVFLCHSSKDVDLVNTIAEDLKAKGITYWLDDEQIFPGSDIIEKITNGLLKSKNIIPCISSNQLKSGWCRKEYHSILGRILSGNSKQNVVPLILDNMKDEDFPLFLGTLRCERYKEEKQYERFINFFR
jgi:hypothetical protein